MFHLNFGKSLLRLVSLQTLFPSVLLTARESFFTVQNLSLKNPPTASHCTQDNTWMPYHSFCFVLCLVGFGGRKLVLLISFNGRTGAWTRDLVHAKCVLHHWAIPSLPWTPYHNLPSPARTGSGYLLSPTSYDSPAGIQCSTHRGLSFSNPGVPSHFPL